MTPHEERKYFGCQTEDTRDGNACLPMAVALVFYVGIAAGVVLTKLLEWLL